jgi:hypothetical protein
VPELERGPDPVREDPEEVAQPVEVRPEVGRELEEDRSQLRAQPEAMRPEALERLLAVAEPADVGQVAVRLHHEQESLGRHLPPPGERLLFRKHVEGVVDLHDREALGEVRQPLPLGEVLRVEAALPVTVLPAAGPDDDLHRGMVTPEWCS